METERVQFDPQIAFSRSVGFLTRDEIKFLQGKTVAIAGLGGVGGSHLLTLTRLGIGGFHLADFDTFALDNFNRQAGAKMSTIGRSKLEVACEMALDINPTLRIETFSSGLTDQNASEFFRGVDLYIDGLDFFAFKARSTAFKACEKLRIPALTVGPIGCGAALLNFLPGEMSFHDYFQWKDRDSDVELGVKFYVGLTPTFPHRKYLVDPSTLNIDEKIGPSTPMGCELCAGVAGTEALKILLKRGEVKSAPHSIHFDAFHNRMFSRYVWRGNRNPMQKLKINMGLKHFAKKQT